MAVDAFRSGALGFTGIVPMIEAVLAAHTPGGRGRIHLAAVSAADGWARTEARSRSRRGCTDGFHVVRAGGAPCGVGIGLSIGLHEVGHGAGQEFGVRVAQYGPLRSDPVVQAWQGE